MTLNSSGPISLGGSTTGQSINLELGQSATTQVSLNDSNVRTLAGVPSGAIVMPIDFWGKSSAAYYAAQLVPISGCYGIFGFPFRINSDKSVTWFAEYNGSGNSLYAFTFNSSGVLSTQKVGITYADYISYPLSGIVDSSNNIYFIQAQDISCSNDKYILIQKVDTSYAVTKTYFTLQKNPSVCYPNNNYFFIGATIDSSGNYYFNITTNSIPLPGTGFTSTTYKQSLVFKTNSSLVGQNFFNVWGGTLYGSESYMSQNSTSTTGRVFTRIENGISCCTASQSSVVAWDKNWAVFFSRGWFQVPTYANVDSSGNVYIFVDNYLSGVVNLYKFDTNGSYVWGKNINIPSGITNICGIQFDSSGNIYIMYVDWDFYATVIIKYTPSGTMQWSRYIVWYPCCSSYNYMQGINIQISPNDTNAFYVTVYNSNNSPFSTVLLRLPLDGSLTGFISTGYESFYYLDASLTDTAATAISSSVATTSPTTYPFTTTSGSDSFSTSSTFTGAVVVL